MSTSSAEQAVRANYERQRTTMTAGNADVLSGLLAEGFTLTHMTGYQQPKQEWLADIRWGTMAYHAIDDVTVSVIVDGDTAVLTARTVTAATIWGAHGTWRLQLRIHYAYTGESWLPTRTVVSAW